MRVIFEEVDREYFFEVILSPEDLTQLNTIGGVIQEYLWENKKIRDINVFVRQEKEPKCRQLARNIAPS